MSDKQKYLILNISNIIMDVIFFIGVLSVTLLSVSLSNGASIYELAMRSSNMGTQVYILFIGLAGTITAGIFSLVYYLFEKQSKVIFVSFILHFATAFFMMIILMMMLNSVLSVSSFSGLSDALTKLKLLGIAFLLAGIIVLAELVYHVIVLLQFLNVVNVQVLAQYMPVFNDVEISQNEPVQDFIETNQLDENVVNDNQKGGEE
jgi:hypothetical protein